MEEGPPASKPDAAARRWLTEELVRLMAHRQSAPLPKSPVEVEAIVFRKATSQADYFYLGRRLLDKTLELTQKCIGNNGGASSFLVDQTAVFTAAPFDKRTQNLPLGGFCGLNFEWPFAYPDSKATRSLAPSPGTLRHPPGSPSGPVFDEVKSLWQLYSSLDDSTRSSSQGIPLPPNQDHNRYCAGGPLVANRRTQVTPLSVLQRISDDSQPVAPPSKKRALSIDSRQDELGLQRGVVAQESYASPLRKQFSIDRNHLYEVNFTFLVPKDRVIEKLTVHLQKNSK